MVNFIQNINDVIIDGLFGVATKNKIDVIEIFQIDFVDTIAILFRYFMVQIQSVLQKRND